jgi:AcrR family transcriptional regulator
MTRLPAKQRREQLLDVAAKLFATSGYARSTTAELAKLAGVTEPIIYRHFNSKRDLFIALVERTAQQTVEQWERVLRNQDDAAERLRRLIGMNPMVAPETREAYRVLLQSISESHDPEVKKAVADHFQNLHAFLVREILRGQEERRTLRVFSPELIAWTLIHIGLGYGVLEALGVENQGRDSKGGHVVELLERLLVGKAEE